MISQIKHLSNFLEGTKARMLLSYERQKSTGPGMLKVIYTRQLLIQKMLSARGKIPYILYAYYELCWMGNKI